MKIKFWGVRGSLPGQAYSFEGAERIRRILKLYTNSEYSATNDLDRFIQSLSHVELNGYGTATTSVQVFSARHGDKNIIIDGGSGIRYISDAVAAKKYVQKEYHIFITHFHLDHIIGLPFFTPHFLTGHKINYYSVQPECEEIVRSVFKKPIFPVGYEDLNATIQFINLKPYETKMVNGFAVTPYKLDHPDPCYGFRVEHDGKVYAHAVDSEIQRRTEIDLGMDSGLYKSADMIYIDAQYAEEEMLHKKGWGHGTFERAFELSHHFKIKQVCMAHYDPNASDESIESFKLRAEKFYEERKDEYKFNWKFVHETEIVGV